MHQSNSYFERCHAADYDPSVSVEQKHRCWAKWLEHYTVGQPPDRVAYARRRLRALRRGETLEPLPGIGPMGSQATSSFLASPADGTSGDEPNSGGSGPEVEEATGAPPGSRGTPSSPAGGERASNAASSDGDGNEEEPRKGSGNDKTKARSKQELPAPPTTVETPCRPLCVPRWYDCVARCPPTSESCEQACKIEHRTCMRACY